MTLDELTGISLGEVDERAALQKRVDTKYLIPRADLDALLERLAGDHDALEIDGERAFRYRSVYFDTPDLECFHDHVDDVRPRFKVRTRCYLDAGACQFEVKVKDADGETDKSSVEHPADTPDTLTDDARELAREKGIGSVDALRPSLITAFRRFTLAAREGGERITGDLGLRLESPDGRVAVLDEGLVLLETKTEEGDARAHDLLAALGHEPVSLSKYRIGIDLLVEPDPTGGANMRHHFAVR